MEAPPRKLSYVSVVVPDPSSSEDVPTIQRVHWGAIVVLLLVKLVLMPLIGWGLMAGVLASNTAASRMIVPDSKWFRLMLLFQWGAPSGVSQLLVLQKLSLPTTSSQVSQLLFWQYLASFLTITGVCSLGISLYF
eukprot:Platyproteum_vivax@DN7120_c0_g1_i1.p2